eukprot:876292_1
MLNSRPRDVGSRHVSPVLPVTICAVITSTLLISTNIYRDEIAESEYVKLAMERINLNSGTMKELFITMEVVVLVLLGTLETTVRCFNIKEGWSGWWPFPMDISGNQEQWTEFHYPELGRRKVQLIAAFVISILAFLIKQSKSSAKYILSWLAFNTCTAFGFWVTFSAMKLIVNEKRPDFFARCYGLPVVYFEENLAANAQAFEYLDKMFFKKHKESDAITVKDCLDFQSHALTEISSLPKEPAGLDKVGYLTNLRTNTRLESEIKKGFRSFPSGHWAGAVYYGTCCLLLTCWVIFKSKSKAIYGLIMLLVVFLTYNAYSMFSIYGDRRHHWWDMASAVLIAATYMGFQFAVWLAFRPKEKITVVENSVNDHAAGQIVIETEPLVVHEHTIEDNVDSDNVVLVHSEHLIVYENFSGNELSADSVTNHISAEIKHL